MRAHTLISILVAGGAAAVAGGVLAASKPGAVFADKSPSAIPVDVELVIAVDVSNSMDPEEQALQREGYILGLTSREFLQALRNGSHGRIAITYFEWAGQYDQRIILPWRLIDGPESAEAVTNEIKRTPYRRAPWTSIFGALQFAKPPAACAALSMFLVTAPIIWGRRSPSCAMRCWRRASPSTGCQSC
jgi:hypothetical protein